MKKICWNCEHWQEPLIMLPDGTTRPYADGETDVNATIGINCAPYCKLKTINADTPHISYACNSCVFHELKNSIKSGGLNE